MSESIQRLGLALDELKMDRVDRSKMVLNFGQPKLRPKPPSPSKQESDTSHNVVHLLQKSSGKLNINNEVYEYSAEDLSDLGEIGRGNFGTVNKMRHQESGKVMAVKRIRASIDEKSQKQLLKELEVVMKTSDCSYIVNFYGAIFKEGDCWICMELMTSSLEKTYKAVHKILNQTIPEDILGKIAYSVIKALEYLKTHLNIIHRDVKPSNVLLDVDGCIKLCDFGISGQLVDSIAKTRDAGCQPYMAPERIDPFAERIGYDVRSDVWSLGLTLIEVATGKFPYPMWSTLFDQLNQVVRGDSPQLKNNEKQKFSKECLESVNSCMIKDYKTRPKYSDLLQQPFINAYSKDNNIKSWFLQIYSKVPNLTSLEIETEPASS